MGDSNPDEKIVSYNDVVLRRSDLDILNGPYFVNDRIIEFYFSYLSSVHPSKDVLLVPPSISFWLTNCPDTEALKDFIAPLNFPAKNLVLFPVNDNEDVTMAEGGSHWSLAMFDRDMNTFTHIDSNRGMNLRGAKRLYCAVSEFLSRRLGFNPAVEYVEWQGPPQQINGYDCGLYVTAIARVVCRHWQQRGLGGEDCLIAIKEMVTPKAVSDMRYEISELIRGLMVKE